MVGLRGGGWGVGGGWGGGLGGVYGAEDRRRKRRLFDKSSFPIHMQREIRRKRKNLILSIISRTQKCIFLHPSFLTRPDLPQQKEEEE